MSATLLATNFLKRAQGPMTGPGENRQAVSTPPLRVGVIGLGPLWRSRYRPALAALRDRFQVSGVCDQIEEHSLREAKSLGCAVASGPTDLLDDDGVEALLLLDPQWYRLWPLELACRLGKPAFACAYLDLDESYADALCEAVTTRGLPLMLERPLRRAPALRRLRELQDCTLGPVRLLLCESAEVRLPAAQQGGVPGFPDEGRCGDSALLDCCCDLLPGDPVGVAATGVEGAGLTNLLLEFEGGRALQVTRYPVFGPRGGVRLRAVCDRGTAAAFLPGRVQWTDASGRHADVLPVERPLGQVLLQEFHDAVRGGRRPEPDLERAARLLAWVRTAARSRGEVTG
jgi:predicted dehydrogenase